MKSHPVIDKYGLKTYKSRYEGQRCCISGEELPLNIRIVNVAPILSVLNALSLVSTKVFKYARVSLLPMLASQEETALIREACDRLLGLTDPEWPRDNMGCSSSSYWPCQNWVNSNYHELGTQRAAKALLQHVGTQIDEDSPEGKALRTVADRRWNETRPAAERAPDTKCDEGWVVREHRLKGELLIDVPTKAQATVALNPWENDGHKVIKDELKSELRARWDGFKKVWAVAFMALAMALKEDTLSITPDTPVVVTPRALDALREAWKGSATTEQPKEDTVELRGRKAVLRKTLQRKRGEVLVDLNGMGLKVMFDYPNTDKLQALKDDVKRLSGRWNKENKCWTVGANTLADNLDIFEGHKLVVTPAAVKAMEEVFQRRALSSAMDLDDEELKAKIEAALPQERKLFPFQTAAVAFLENSKGKALIADEMGCVEGEAVVTVKIAGRLNHIPLSKLHQIFHEGEKDITIRSAHGTKIGFTRVKNVLDKGTKPVLRLDLASNKSICVTPDHEICTGVSALGEQRYQEAQNLEAGSKVVVSDEGFAKFDATSLRGDVVLAMEEAGKRPVYDVVCEAPYHNFVANGIVVHNCGKTIETAAFLAYRKDLRPAVVVVPAVVSPNWVKELEAWTTDEKIFRVKKGKDTVPADASIVVVTYDLLKEKVEIEKGKTEMQARGDIKALAPKCVVADECHVLRNIKAQRNQAFLKLAKQSSVESVVMLSGTPIVNRPKEFYTALTTLRPDEFNSWFKYTERYCGGHRTKWGYKCDGATNLEELSSRLKDVMIRRRKEDVLKELPAKMRGTFPVQITPKARATYNRAVKNADTALTQITAGRHALGLAKVAPALDMIADYTDQNQPLLVFAHHKDVMDGLCQGLDKAKARYGRIDGMVSQDRRSQLVDSFQAGNLDVMVLSVKAAGVGITLTRASNVLFVEMSFVPADMLQAEDRAHRIGQDNPVTVRVMEVVDSMDEDMTELLTQKMAVLSSVLDQGKALPEGLTDIRQELASRLSNSKKD